MPPVTETETLQSRFREVKARIAAAAISAGRAADSVLLVAVSKYAGLDQIRELVVLGQRDFGENQIQQMLQRSAMIDEWIARQKAIAPYAVNPSASLAVTGKLEIGCVRWHMIGQLQRNKAKKAIEVCRLIHSIKDLRMAEDLHELSVVRDGTVEILIQVNASGEGTKSGCAMPAVPYLIEQIETMSSVRVRGLMTMAPHSERPEDARPTFARLREVFEDVRRDGVAGPHFNILSMGMSHDFEVAISEGSNLVRVGSSIFGDRPAGGAADDDTDAHTSAEGESADTHYGGETLADPRADLTDLAGGTFSPIIDGLPDPR